MNLDRIKELSNFLLDGSPTLDDLARHLFINTLNFCDPQAIFFAHLGTSSEVQILTGFGNTNPRINEIHSFSLTTSNPFCDSIRKQSFQRGELSGVNGNCGIDLEDLRSEPNSKFLNRPWVHYVSVPIGRRGSLVTFFHESPISNEKEEEFFLFVGILLAIYFQTFIESSLPQSNSVSTAATGRGLNSLTMRQIKILKLVRTGATNHLISKEIGYSESLVRQELVRIFRILGTSSRIELREFDFPTLD